MLWLISAISCYLILAIVFLVDKYLLSSPILSPKFYAFYVGILGILTLLIAPFVGFYIPGYFQIFLSSLAGFFFICSLYWLYKSLWLFETSRVIPAIGGLIPLFSLFFIYIFSQGKEILKPQEIFSLAFLILGSVLITYERSKISLKSLSFSATAAIFWSLTLVLSKYVYLEQPFWNGFILIRVSGAIFAIFFLIFSKELREGIFQKRKETLFSSSNKKTATIFVLNQSLGAGANILQNFAIFLAPLAYVALINALQGIQYVFLLIFAVIISLKFPQIIKEEISGKIIFQKVFAVSLIGTGLIILAI